MNEEMKSVLELLHMRPIAFHPCFAGMTGSMASGLMLSQIMYWHSKVGRKFWKTDDELAEETGLNKRTLCRGKKKLEELDFLTITAEGLPRKTYYEIDEDKYFNCLKNYAKSLKDNKVSQYRQNVNTSVDKVSELVLTKCPNKYRQNGHTITETTKTEITNRDYPPNPLKGEACPEDTRSPSKENQGRKRIVARNETPFDLSSHIVSEWNILAKKMGFPSVIKVGNPRKKKINTRIKSYPSKSDWDAIFSSLRKQKHLAAESWFNFDFLIRSDENVEKARNDWMRWKVERKDDKLPANALKTRGGADDRRFIKKW